MPREHYTPCLAILISTFADCPPDVFSGTPDTAAFRATYHHSDSRLRRTFTSKFVGLCVCLDASTFERQKRCVLRCYLQFPAPSWFHWPTFSDMGGAFSKVGGARFVTALPSYQWLVPSAEVHSLAIGPLRTPFSKCLHKQRTYFHTARVQRVLLHLANAFFLRKARPPR